MQTDWDSSHGGSAAASVACMPFSPPQGELCSSLGRVTEQKQMVGGGGVTCFISIPLPHRLLLNHRRFQSGKSQICHTQILAAREHCNKGGGGDPAYTEIKDSYGVETPTVSCWYLSSPVRDVKRLYTRKLNSHFTSGENPHRLGTGFRTSPTTRPSGQTHPVDAITATLTGRGETPLPESDLLASAQP